MKKIFISLIILILAAGTVFYFGWVQIQIPPGSYAVIYTKTGGYDENVVLPGQFSWRWEKLFPTNMIIYIFPVSIQKEVIHISGELPSAHVYSLVLQNKPDFSYDLSYRVTFSINPDKLPVLVKEENLTPESLNTLYSSIKDSGSAILSSCLFKAINEKKQIYDISTDIISEMAKEFPYLEIRSINPEKIIFPDIDLYLKAKSSYLAINETRNTILLTETAKSAKDLTTSEKKIEVLKQYGELLKEYPIILDYLKLDLDKDFLFQSLGIKNGE